MSHVYPDRYTPKHSASPQLHDRGPSKSSLRRETETGRPGDALVKNTQPSYDMTQHLESRREVPSGPRTGREKDIFTDNGSIGWTNAPRGEKRSLEDASIPAAKRHHLEVSVYPVIVNPVRSWTKTLSQEENPELALASAMANAMGQYQSTIRLQSLHDLKKKDKEIKALKVQLEDQTRKLKGKDPTIRELETGLKAKIEENMEDKKKLEKELRDMKKQLDDAVARAQNQTKEDQDAPVKKANIIEELTKELSNSQKLLDTAREREEELEQAILYNKDLEQAEENQRQLAVLEEKVAEQKNSMSAQKEKFDNTLRAEKEKFENASRAEREKFENASRAEIEKFDNTLRAEKEKFDNTLRAEKGQTARARHELSIAYDRLGQSEVEVKRLEKEVCHLKEVQMVMEKNIEQNTTKITTLNSQIADSEKREQETQDRNTRKREELHVEIARLTEEVTAGEKTAKELRGKLEKSGKDLAEGISKMTKVEEEMKLLDKRNLELKGKLKESGRDLAKGLSRMTRVEGEMKALEERNQELEHEAICSRFGLRNESECSDATQTSASATNLGLSSMTQDKRKENLTRDNAELKERITELERIISNTNLNSKPDTERFRQLENRRDACSEDSEARLGVVSGAMDSDLSDQLAYYAQQASGLSETISADQTHQTIQGPNDAADADEDDQVGSVEDTHATPEDDIDDTSELSSPESTEAEETTRTKPEETSRPQRLRPVHRKWKGKRFHVVIPPSAKAREDALEILRTHWGDDFEEELRKKGAEMVETPVANYLRNLARVAKKYSMDQFVTTIRPILEKSSQAKGAWQLQETEEAGPDDVFRMETKDIEAAWGRLESVMANKAQWLSWSEVPLPGRPRLNQFRKRRTKSRPGPDGLQEQEAGGDA